MQSKMFYKAKYVSIADLMWKISLFCEYDLIVSVLSRGYYNNNNNNNNNDNDDDDDDDDDDDNNND